MLPGHGLLCESFAGSTLLEHDSGPGNVKVEGKRTRCAACGTWSLALVTVKAENTKLGEKVVGLLEKLLNEQKITSWWS